MVAQFEIYEDIMGKYRWRLRSSGNYKIIADSTESYIRKEDCERGIKLVKTEAPTAMIQYL